MSDNIKIIINGKETEAKRDTFLLNSIKELGIKIPTLCFHKDLAPNGSCRLCMCEIEDARGRKKMVTACNFPIRGEIKVNTQSDKVKKHKKMLAEMYLSRWPEVPAIKKIAKDCGAIETRFENELTDTNPKACILCGRCTRACDEFTLERIIGSRWSWPETTTCRFYASAFDFNWGPKQFAAEAEQPVFHPCRQCRRH